MVKIQPFKGYTYMPEDYETLLRFNHESISALEEYKRAYVHQESTVEQIEAGMLIQDESPCFYVYMQTFMNQNMVGLIAEASLKDYENQNIKIHENTLCREGYNHQSYAKDHVGPVVFSYYCDGGKIKNHLLDITKANAPFAKWRTADGRSHALWKAADQDCGLTECFSTLSAFYVLDGHHRLKAASENYAHNKSNPKAEFLQALIYPPDQVSIHPFHRLLLLHEDMNVLRQLEEKGIPFTEIKDATKQHLDDFEIIYKTGNRYFGFNFGEGRNSVENLSVSKLKNNILDQLYECSHELEKSLNFVPGIHDWEELTKHDNIFLVQSVKIEEIFKIADEKHIMPPKSTWFEPKPCNKMVVRLPY